MIEQVTKVYFMMFGAYVFSLCAYKLNLTALFGIGCLLFGFSVALLLYEKGLLP